MPNHTVVRIGTFMTSLLTTMVFIPSPTALAAGTIASTDTPRVVSVTPQPTITQLYLPYAWYDTEANCRSAGAREKQRNPLLVRGYYCQKQRPPAGAPGPWHLYLDEPVD